MRDDNDFFDEEAMLVVRNGWALDIFRGKICRILFWIRCGL